MLRRNFVLICLVLFFFIGCTFLKDLDPFDITETSPPSQDIFESIDIVGQIKQHNDEKPASFKQSMLPQPILENHPEWVKLYFKSWEVAYKNVKAPLIWNSNQDYFLDEGFDDACYQWDSSFMMHWAVYLQGAFSTIRHPMSALDNFYFKQHENGAICREISEKTGHDNFNQTSAQFTNPPLFSWTEWMYFMKTGDKQRLEWVFPMLDKYYAWYTLNRTRATGHYWWNNLGSGMDNAPRSPYSWVDYTAMAALDTYYLSKIALEIGETDKAAFYSNKYEQIKKLVNETMWDVQNTMYWDLDQKNKFQKNLTIASFWPMIAKIPTANQIKGLLTYLESSQFFKTKHRIPSLPVSHKNFSPDGKYWQGSVWAPTNFMIIKGLQYNHFEDLATEISENHIENISQLYQLSGTIWENYSPTSLQRGSSAKSDFCGWSCLGPIALLIENIIGIRINVPAHEVFWRLRRLEKHGLLNLRFGEAKISLVADKRTYHQDPIYIEVKSTHEFMLKLDTEWGIFSEIVKPGKHQYQIKP